jgi:hypothetical protein
LRGAARASLIELHNGFLLMKNRAILLLGVFAAGLAAVLVDPAFGQERAAARPQSGRGTPIGDMLGTMQHGTYQCALPGDAGGQAYLPQPDEEFRIAPGSSYHSPQGIGVYLMQGANLLFTRGPKKDQRFRRIGPNTLQQVAEDGTLSKLICTRLGGTN